MMEDTQNTPTTADYGLLIVQQPGTLSASFFQTYRENDRKSVINPCPIIQLVKIEPSGVINKSIESLGNISQLVGNASLLSIDNKDVSFVSVDSLQKNPKFHSYVSSIKEKYDSNIKSVPYERVLDGNTVSQCHILRDVYGSLGAYFVFEDIAVNLEGLFRLKVCIHDLNRPPSPICCIITEPFRSLASKEYNYLGGIQIILILESSEISKIFARQGIRIPITRKSSLHLANNDE